MSILRLINTLNGLSDIHEQLLQLAREKQQVIIDNRVDQLMVITAKENKAITAVEQLNREVNRLTGECCEELGLTPKTGTLADIIQAVYQVDRKHVLSAAADLLRRHLQQLKELNDHNQMLVSQSLEYLEFQIELFTAPVDDGTYSARRSVQSGAPRRTFDTRV